MPWPRATRCDLNPTKLTFYSLTNNEPVRTVRTPKDLDAVITEIREVAAQIRKQLFPPKPGFACKYCDYDLDLPGARRKLLTSEFKLWVLE